MQPAGFEMIDADEQAYSDDEYQDNQMETVEQGARPCGRLLLGPNFFLFAAGTPLPQHHPVGGPSGPIITG